MFCIVFIMCLVQHAVCASPHAGVCNLAESSPQLDHALQCEYGTAAPTELATRSKSVLPLPYSQRSCIDAIYAGMSPMPRVLGWNPDFETSDSLIKCTDINLPIFFKMTIFFSSEQQQLHDALAHIGAVKQTGAHLPAEVLDAAPSARVQTFLGTLLELGLCLPEECHSTTCIDISVALMIVAVPSLSEEMIANWIHKMMGGRCSDLPLLWMGHTIRLGDVSPSAQRPDDMIESLLALNRLALTLESRMVNINRMRWHFSKYKSWIDAERDGGFLSSNLLHSAWNSEIQYATSSFPQLPELVTEIDSKYKLLQTMAAELGIFNRAGVALNAFDLGCPIQRNSTSKLALAGTPGHELSAYLMTDVCVRDLSIETDFMHAAVESTIPTGHRLELITVGLGEVAVASLQQRPSGGRFVFTHLGSPLALARHFKGMHVVAWRGQSQFLYDGHASSTRCPNCANIWHHLLDDLLLDLVVWFTNRDVVDRVVVNLLASVGHEGPKRWFKQLLESLAGDLELNKMYAGDVFCFERVTISFNSHGGKGMRLVLHRFASFSGVPASSAFAWAHNRVWADISGSVVAELQMLSMAIYARQNEKESNKPRQWVDYERVAQELGAEIIIFGQAGFVAEAILMRSIRVLITVPGAHHSNSLFLQPGSIWIDLLCPQIAFATNFPPSVYQFMDSDFMAARNVHYAYIEAANCPPMGKPREPETWLPVTHHPLTVLGMLRGLHVIHSGRWLCTWRRAADVNISHDILEVVEGQQCAILRCASWEEDCNSIHESDLLGTWYLFRSNRGSLRKWSCVEVWDGRAKLPDRSSTVRHELYNRNLIAPANMSEQVLHVIEAKHAFTILQSLFDIDISL